MRVYIARSVGLHNPRYRKFKAIPYSLDFIDVTDEPSHTIKTLVVPMVLARDEHSNPTDPNKPAYSIPTMVEVGNLPWNKFIAASTFSGCGGSSLGYRMAGFKVLWASEFVEAARTCYEANKADYTYVDPRDIRLVGPEEILSRCNISSGELDLLDGSPPCAAFSTAGSMDKHWGKVKDYSDRKQRVDDLFWEFSRILKGVQPKTFVAENVVGLTKGKAKGYFVRIMEELRGCGYKVQCRILDAQWLGVPQKRPRAIIVGVREDIGKSPVFPDPWKFRYSVREAIPWLTVEGQEERYLKRKITMQELRRICAFPDDFVLTGTGTQQWERLGRAVPPLMMKAVAETIRDKVLSEI